MTKLLSALFGILLCLPTCFVVGYGVSQLVGILSRTPRMEGARAMGVFQLSLILGPALALLCGVAHFVLTRDAHPTTAYLIEVALLVPSAVLLWLLIK